MNRLTQKDKQGNWCIKDLPWKELYVGQAITQEVWEKMYGCLRKLMEYEETGLSPEDVVRLDEFEQTQAAHLLKKLNEEQRKHRWIPVAERLPEDSENMVLVQVSGKPEETITLHNAMQLASYDSGCGWIPEMRPEWEDAEPVAWMPLPEPYRPDRLP